MRMSCNGCRVLRKGCSDNCSIRPCLQWIKSPESQANATVFLAKFYGRAGLLNLVNSGPDHLRPAIFRSLLYEACGRVLNPIYGSTGLLWAGNWHICQSAVEAVLQGLPIVPIAADAAVPPLKVYDIRHVSKEEITAKGGDGVRHVRRTCRFKRAKSSASTTMEVNRSNSHESSLVLQSEPQEAESSVAVETADLLSLCRAPLGGRPDVSDGHDEFDIQLELSLGWQSQSSTCGSCQCEAWQHGNSESRNESMGGV